MLVRTAVLSLVRRPGQALLVGIAVIAASAFAASALLIALNARSALVSFGMSTPEAADAVVVPPVTVDSAGAATLSTHLGSVPGTVDVVVEHLGDVEVEVGGTTSSWKLSSDPGSGPLSRVPDLTGGRSLEVGELVLGTGTAERTGAAVGDRVLVDGHEFEVAAIGPMREFGRDAALIHEEDAAELGSAMAPVQIFVTGDPDLDELRAVAEGSSVQSGEVRRAQEASSVTDTATGVFGALALFVLLSMISAAVIVGSAFRIVLVRRASELALLRVIGAGRKQVRRLVLCEAAGIGLVGGAAGVLIGVGIAAVMVEAARSFGLVNEPLLGSPVGLAACVALSVLCAVLAAIPAARSAGRASPVEALGASRSVEARPVRRRDRAGIALVLGLTAALTAVGATAVSGADEFLALVIAACSGLLVFGALAALGPLLVSGSASLLRPVVARSLSARLAVANIRRASRRTAAMTTVLTLGVGLTAALAVGVSGASTEARASVAENFPSPAIIPTSMVADPEATASRLAQHPDVEARLEGLDILIDPAPGVSTEDLRTAVLQSTDPGTTVFWASDVLVGIEQMILIGQVVGAAMIGVTILVALIGVMVTLALSVTERRSEIALLRALGVSRAGARRSIAAEAVLAALVSAVAGTAIGSAYGVLALHLLGMSTGAPPLLSLGAVVLAVTAAALVAAAAPMWSAGRVPPALGLAAR